ncbi:hypothetical protein ADP71_31880 [Vitreoscilla sp. C1]|uniref:hypothetical protein n=1 Tax=Vitreoscilla sp. (strain C1) TaxID=96942 RepID=UPI000CDBDFAE|nr:hypothetical protein [Vitreoscilla sp. C1]AUZ06366.1 hypothetical protein ADP71_31880 [Vitreoscilla sp. C1]
MLAIRPLATSPLAVHVATGAAVDIVYEGVALLLPQSVGEIAYEGVALLLPQAIVHEVVYQGIALQLPQEMGVVYEGVALQLPQTMQPKPLQYVFEDSFQDFGPFNLNVETDLGSLDVCQLFDRIEITQASGEASTAKLSFLQDVGERIDLYQYLNRKMRIELVRPDKPAFVLFDGEFDASIWQVGGFFIEWSALTPRKRMLNQLTQAQVDQIGYFQEDVFKKRDDYDDMATQLEDRMSTIPANLDFIDGQPFVNSWFAKIIPDYVLGPCEIEEAHRSHSVNSQDSIVNTVVVKLQHQWDLCRYAERKYWFDSRYTVCNYANYGLPPLNDTVKAAAQNTGWVLSHYESSGLHDGGIYRCSWRGGFPAEMIWSPRGGTFEPVNESGRSSRVVYNYTDLYAQRCSLMLSKQFVQPVEESILMTVQNAASVRRYGERKQTQNVTVTQVREDATDRKIKNWENQSTYKNPAKQGAIKQANGYWIIQADNIKKGALQQALDVAVRIAETNILKSHRSHKFVCRTDQIAPQLDITQTHEVDAGQVSGRFKVDQITHVFDLQSTQKSYTEVTYVIFSNAENGSYVHQAIEPPRAALNHFAKPQYQSQLGVFNIHQGARVFYEEGEYEDWESENTSSHPAIKTVSIGQTVYYYKLHGWITETTDNNNGVEIRQSKDFQVVADEIEEETTETMEVEVTRTIGVGIPNDEQELIA